MNETKREMIIIGLLGGLGFTLMMLGMVLVLSITLH